MKVWGILIEVGIFFVEHFLQSKELCVYRFLYIYKCTGYTMLERPLSCKRNS